MGLPQEVRATFYNSWRGDSLRQIVLPAGAAVTLTANAAGSTYGNWADVALLATVLVDTLVIGVVVSAPSAPDVFTVDIGSAQGYANAAAVVAAGAAAIAAAHRREVRVESQGAAGGAATDIQTLQGYIPLRSPVWIPAGVGIIGRCYGITAAAVTIDVSVVCEQLFK